MDYLYSPSSLASDFAGELFSEGQRINTWIITGPRGVGKTSFCQEVRSRLDLSGVSLGGVLSEPKMEGNTKTGIFLENLKTGEKQLLGTKSAGESHSLVVGCWYFNPEVLAWGNDCLHASMGSDVVIFDECGFLELESGSGLVAGLQLFDQQAYKAGLVVVRPELLPIAQQRWPNAAVVDLGVINQ